jgi:membrane associated rhomboid family serine protease
MFPIRDDQPRFSTPYVNYFIIALNVLVYVFFELPVKFQGPRHFNALIAQFGFVPAHLTHVNGIDPQYPLPAALLTIFTSMFLHADLFHIVGNLWFLWIFGDNIEDFLGHFTYLVFYLLCGVAAALSFIAIEPSSTLPTLGASGAIAGVMGAYIVLYPKARVQTLVVLIVFITFWWIPAWVFLGYWFFIPFIATSMEASATAAHQTGGVAFAAHVGGFIAGVIMVKVFPRRAQTARYGTW